jgi:hypothetical protein
VSKKWKTTADMIGVGKGLHNSTWNPIALGQASTTVFESEFNRKWFGISIECVNVVDCSSTFMEQDEF